MKDIPFQPPFAAEAVMSDAAVDVMLNYRIPGAGFPVVVASFFPDDDDGGPLRPGEMTTQQAERLARFFVLAANHHAALVAMLGRYVDELAASRGKPVGAPNSAARKQQDTHILIEDAARNLLAEISREGGE